MNTRVNRLLGGKLVRVAAFLLGLGSVARAQMPAPEPLVVTAVTANTVSLAWNDIYSDEDGFLLTRWDNLGNQTTFQFAPNVTNYLDTNLITGSIYSYQVVAFNSGGPSDAAWAQATPTPIPAPAPLEITGVTANTVGLSWNDIYTNEDGFILTRWDNVGNQTTFQFGPNVTNYLDTNLITGSIYSYQVVAFNSGGQSDAAWTQAVPTPIPAPAPLVITGVTANTVGLSWNDIYTNEDGFILTRWDNVGNQTTFQFGPNVTNYLDTNLITGSIYSYQVVAFNSGGQSYAAWAQATPTPIPAPAPLVISGVTANTVGLVWNDIYDDEDGFFLTRWDNVGNQTTFQFGPNVTSYLDTNLITGAIYSYQVVTFNSGGQSYPAYNSATPTPIAAPAPLLITGVTSNTVTLTWNDIYSNEDGFLLTRWDNLGNQATFQFGPNVTSYTDTNLITGNTYYYQVVAFNSGGQSAAAFVSATPTANPSPAPLLITDISSNAISLAWNDIFGNEEGFQLERSTDSVNFVVITLTGPNVTNYTDTPLPPASDYFYRVAAFNSGGLSAYATTNITIVPTPPAAPSGLTAYSGYPTEVDLTWTDNAYNETQYYVEQSTNGIYFTPAAILYGANWTSYNMIGLRPATTYYFRVRAQNATGNSPWSNIASATTPDFSPPTPENLTATSISTAEIDLNWTITIPYDWQGLININGYHIYISGDGTNFTFLDTVTNGWSYASTGLNPDTTYFYRVTSFNTAGDSDATPVVSATTRHIVGPSGLSVTAISASQIDLSWTDNATNESGFNVYISTNGFTFSLLATLSSDVTSYSSTGLRPLTTYYYRVTAFDSTSESAPSNVGIATTPDVVPASPSGLSATALNDTGINLSWTDNATNETGFKVYVSTNGTTFSLLATLGKNVTFYPGAGFHSGTTYYFRVTAFNAVGESAAASANATTQEVAPLFPTALSAAAISATQINLSWTDNADNETGFKVYISTDGTNFDLLATLGANVTSYSSIGLNSATAYYYRVTAFNAVGESAAARANATTPDVVPASPSGLAATAINGSQISLSWTDNANNETGFKVYISTNGTTFNLLATLGANVTTYSSTGLSIGTTYYYRVTAFNAVGESAASSVIGTTQNVPAAPSGLSATVISTTQINLSWTDNATNETGFKVYIYNDATGIFNLLATLSANVTNYSSTNLNPATAYPYRVTAFNSAGESTPASANATTADVVPASPSGLSANAASFGTQINLTWTDNANNETGFKVYVSTNGTTFSLLATIGYANVPFYTSTGLNPGTTYYFRVTAFNASGESTPASTNATTPDVPSSPSGLSAITSSTSQLNLSWTDNATNETGFKVYISTDGTIFNLLATLGVNVTTYSSTGLNTAATYYYRVAAFNDVGQSTPSSANGTTADVVPVAPWFLFTTTISATQVNLTWGDLANNETGFKVYISTDGATFSLLATVGPNVTSYSSTGLNPARTYYYRVTAFNAVGESASSETASAATPDVPPLAPSGLSASAVSSNLVTLNWTDNANNESGFLIERSTDGINFTQIGTVGAGVTTFTDSVLAAETAYYYRVRATNTAGNSAYSNIASATTGPAAPPTAPSNLTLTVISASQINLHWNDNSSNETQFLIERSPNGSSFTQIATVGANVQSYSATGLQSNTRYYFRVRATNSAGYSAYSNAASAKTTPH